MGIGVRRRANSSLAGVVAALGLARGGRGVGSSVPLSCAPAALTVSTSRRLDRTSVFALGNGLQFIASPYLIGMLDGKTALMVLPAMRLRAQTIGKDQGAGAPVASLWPMATPRSASTGAAQALPAAQGVGKVGRPIMASTIAQPRQQRRLPSLRMCSVARHERGSLSHIHLQGRNECLLRDVDLAELAHALLAFLLLLEKLALARDIAAIAFGGDIFAQCPDGLARRSPCRRSPPGSESGTYAAGSVP